MSPERGCERGRERGVIVDSTTLHTIAFAVRLPSPLGRL